MLQLTWSYNRSERKSFTHYYEGLKAVYNYIGRREDNVLDIDLQKPSILRASPENRYLNENVDDMNDDYLNWINETGTYVYLRPTSAAREPAQSTTRSITSKKTAFFSKKKTIFLDAAYVNITTTML